MKQSELKLLQNRYENYLKTNDRDYSFSFLGLSQQEQDELCNSIEFLMECNYLQVTARSLGSWIVKLTIEGIKFAENGYKEPENHSVLQGNNSIYINGSGNTVSDNYSQIFINISESDLPDESKLLITDFLYEMRNPNLTSEKKSNKIKEFLMDITSGSISGVAASGLTTLFTSLFSQIKS